jgi:DNA-binding HxlR family transcriptional regulator
MDRSVKRPVAARRSTEFRCPVRDILDRIGDAWSALVITTLAERTLRFNELKREVEGVSQRMLTVTLRNLERDGLVSRFVLPAAPPRVEYSLTVLGRSLLDPLASLKAWAAEHQPAVQAARKAYDADES